MWRIRGIYDCCGKVVGSTEFGAALTSAVQGDVRVIAYRSGGDPFEQSGISSPAVRRRSLRHRL
jgi:hypothetical protein